MYRPPILDEDKLTLEEARSEFGTNGTPADFSTVYNAVAKGNVLPDGSRLRLEAIRVAGRWITSKEAIERFVIALTEAWSKQGKDSDRELAENPVTAKREASRRLKAADAVLAGRGIC